MLHRTWAFRLRSWDNRRKVRMEKKRFSSKKRERAVGKTSSLRSEAQTEGLKARRNDELIKKRHYRCRYSEKRIYEKKTRMRILEGAKRESRRKCKRVVGGAESKSDLRTGGTILRAEIPYRRCVTYPDTVEGWARENVRYRTRLRGTEKPDDVLIGATGIVTSS